MDEVWEYDGIEDGWHVWRRFDGDGNPIEEKCMPVKDAPADFEPTDEPPVDAWVAEL